LPENDGTETKTDGKPCAVKVACTVWGRRGKKHAMQIGSALPRPFHRETNISLQRVGYY